MGPKLGRRAPIFRDFLGAAQVSPGIFFVSEASPPGTFGVFSDRRTRRVPRPLFPGDVEVGKSADLAKGGGGEDNGRRWKKPAEEIGQRKMTIGARTKRIRKEHILQEKKTGVEDAGKGWEVWDAIEFDFGTRAQTRPKKMIFLSAYKW